LEFARTTGGAFRNWAIKLLDAVAGEYLEQPQTDIEDWEAAVIDGPGKWLIGRAYDPIVLEAVVLKALVDAGFHTAMHWVFKRDTDQYRMTATAQFFCSDSCGTFLWLILVSCHSAARVLTNRPPV
jgi:hypothetical protein